MKAPSTVCGTEQMLSKHGLDLSLNLAGPDKARLQPGQLSRLLGHQNMSLPVDIELLSQCPLRAPHCPSCPGLSPGIPKSPHDPAP